MMLVVGLIFGALWVTALVQGDRMDELTRQHLAEAEADSGQPPTDR
jgi:hypothetical protein